MAAAGAEAAATGAALPLPVHHPLREEEPEETGNSSERRHVEGGHRPWPAPLRFDHYAGAGAFLHAQRCWPTTWVPGMA
jgi:hypothetical protein